MNEIDEDIKQKNSNLFSRNRPVALVVGAASFLGSHLVDELLNKKIQVVGIDDLQDGEKRNLRQATENRDFHLLINSPKNLNLEFLRLDYIFIMPSANWNLGKVLELFKKFNSRILLVSSIDLYESKVDGQLGWLREMEVKIAKFAKEEGLNARILRLGPLYGPRMDFKTKDPLIKLIRQALKNDLQKEVSLDFSSRALFVADAVDLAIKTIFAGSTAQKIFDGVLPTPVKVEEVKQVLLDPVWYEEKDFDFTELPPWPSPNLDKTIKFLNWRPKANTVSCLKQTLSYFKDNEIEIPAAPEKDENGAAETAKVGWSEEKKEHLTAFRNEKTHKSLVRPIDGSKYGFAKILSKIYLFTVIFLVAYALIWPLVTLGWGIFVFQYQFSSGFKNLALGEFDKSLGNINQAAGALGSVKSVFSSLEPIRKFGILSKQLESVDNVMNLAGLSVDSSRSAILGIRALFQSLKAITGELAETPSDYLSLAQVELSSANEDLAKASVLLDSKDFRKNTPQILAGRISGVGDKLALYGRLVKEAQTVSVVLPSLIGADVLANKNYLVLLQNNMELRPGGGFIGSFAKVSFEGGKLKSLSVNDIYAIDGQLNIHVEPPKEIKEDLGQKDWYLRDSNWEADFPTSARQAEWFYTRETGERVDGVVALDISAMEELLKVVGSLDLADYNEKITSANLFEKAISYAEVGFFPGSQAKKSFLTSLTNQLFNKMFFLPGQNWPAIISALGKSLNTKHISVYLNDPKLFSYLDAAGWTHILPRGSDQNKGSDFLSLVEANLGANKVNYYLDRSYKLDTVVGREGEISHRLRVSFTNRSPSNAFPGGTYKNRMRIYLPFGTKLTRVLWGEADITNSVASFVDFGRSGYSLLLSLSPKEQKILVLDYVAPIKVEFQGGKAAYRLDVIKQAGTLKDPFEWNISYPINYQLVSNLTEKIGPQEQTISTDLSTDRSFQVEFKK